MRRNLLLAALLAVLACVSVWLLRDSSDGASIAATVRGTDESAAGERGPQENASEVARTDERRELGAAAATDAAITPEIAAENGAVPALEGEQVEIRVVDRATQKPVGGARVVRFENPGHDPAFDVARVLRRGDLDSLLEASAGAKVTDSNGVVHFARAKEPTVVAARFEGLLGTAACAPDMIKPTVVELVPDGDVAVRAVDAFGRPAAGVPLALRRGASGLFNDYSLAETDAEGRASLRHALGFVLARPKPVPWRVALRGVFDPQIAVEIDAAVRGGAPAQITVPVHGECEVEVLDERGELCTETLSIGLRVMNDKQPQPLQGWYVSDGGMRFEDVTTGRQLFRFVQLASPLEAFAVRAGSDVVHRAQASAITSAGQRAKITLKLAETACLLTGRVLDESGQALSASSLHARTQRPTRFGSAVYSESALALDAQGRFCFDVDVFRGTAPNSFVVYTCDADGHEQLSAVRELPAPLEVGLHDLGDLTLEPSPRVAAGIVLDHRGQPVAGATIQIETQDREETNPSWDGFGLPETRSDAQGRFDVRARIALPEIRVLALRDGSSSNAVTTQPGAGDLVLRLPEGGHLAGRVLLDEALGRSNALIEVRYAEGADGEDPPPTRHMMLDKQNEFEFRGLRVGTYEVRISSPTNWIPLARVTDVVVEADRTTRDPRLDPLDLRGQLLNFTLRVVDAHDQPVPQSWLVVHRGDLGDERFDDSIALGNTIKRGIVCSLEGVDLRAGAPGMRDVELRGVKSNTTIVLTPGPRLRLTLAAPAQLRAPFELGVILLAEGRTQSIGGLQGTPPRFDVDGVALCQSPVIGRARVQFVVVRASANSSAWADVESTTPQFIDIRDEPGEQSFQLTFDPVDLDTAQRQIAGG